jgi:hypothetical protein
VRCQRHVKPPTRRRTRDLERSNFLHKRPPASEATLLNPAGEGETMGEKWPIILPKVTTSTSLLGSFTCRKARKSPFARGYNNKATFPLNNKKLMPFCNTITGLVMP